MTPRNSQDDSPSLFALLLNLLNLGWKKLLPLLAIIIVVSVIFTSVVLFLGTRLFGLKIKEGKIYLGVSETVLSPRVEVPATSGWVNSGIFLHKGQKVVLDPSGRALLAMNHAFNLAQTIKPFIINNTPGHNWPESTKKRYPLPNLADTNVFFRRWSGPDGDSIPSDVFDGCRLRTDLNMGTLLAVMIPTDASIDSEDPIRAVKERGLTLTDIHPVSHRIDFVADRDGYIAFIVNEAVMSPYSDSTDSREFYDAIRKVSSELSNDPIHKLYESSIPLLLYNDNMGSFIVVVKEPG